MATTTTPPTSSQEVFPGNPNAADPGYLNRGYGLVSGSRPNSYVATNSIVPTEFHVRNGTPAIDGNPSRFHEELDTSRRGSSLDVPRTESQMAMSHPALPSRASTLKKKASLSKRGSFRRSSSRKSSRAGSVRSINFGEKERYGVTEDEQNSAFYVPIPTSGSPTELLANRFQGACGLCPMPCSPVKVFALPIGFSKYLS